MAHPRLRQDHTDDGEPARLAYRLAYEEAQRTLDDQANEMSSIRDRAVTFLAMVAVATAFLVTAGVSGHRDFWFRALAGLATVLSLTSLSLTAWMLSPYRKKVQWTYRMSAQKMISWIDAEVRPLTDNAVLKKMVEFYDSARKANEDVLASVRKRYYWAVVTGGAGIATWSVWLWVRG